MSKPNMTPAALTARFMGFGGLFTAFSVVFDPMTAFAFTVAAYVVIAMSK